MNVKSFFRKIEYNDTKPAVEVLLESDFTKEIRIVFRKDQIMKEHKTPFPIVIEIVQGDVEFGAKGNRELLKIGDIVALEGGVPHDLKAHSDSIVRLTLSTLDKLERVKNVAAL